MKKTKTIKKDRKSTFIFTLKLEFDATVGSWLASVPEKTAFVRSLIVKAYKEERSLSK